MTFQPVLPLSGYSGWRFLQRTLDAQQTAFKNSGPVSSLTDYFRENIGKVTTAKELVSDRRLLQVALGAFGLDDDIRNKFFIQKVLEDGTLDPEALSSRLSDKRYADISRAFGFGDPGGPITAQDTFADRMISRFETKQFERAVGESDNDLRAALNLKSGLADIAAKTQSANAQWFSVMGNAPLRKVIETALGLPASIASIDIDQQLTAFKSRARATFGSDKLSDLATPENQEKLIRLYLIRSQAQSARATSSGSIALTLLQAGQ
jgi:hypothetical protein